jgi:exopolysaccharide biosynthesis WecB/TagA/CpsF family protein
MSALSDILVPPAVHGARGDRASFERGRFAIRPADALNADAPTRLFGLPLVNAERDAAAAAIVARAAAGEESIIQFINAHCINMLGRSRPYRRALGRAGALLPDGAGMRIAARWSGMSLRDNLNGTDLFPHLCHHAAAQGQRIFLLGGKPGIATMAATRMASLYGNDLFAGTRHGYFSAAETDWVIAQINRSGASILLVGMGVPQQEIWIAQHRNRITVPIIMGVGGLFDYYSGAIPRAPLALRKVGLEWAWRLAQEPQRLARRYVIGNAAFLIRAARAGVNGRGFGMRISRAIKRTVDLGITAGGLIVTLPVFAAVAAAIRLEDGGPVLFRQTRIGEHGRPFAMLKFRSMVPDAEQRRADLLTQTERDDVCFKMKHDPRITRVGAFLRRFSLDELPQLLNVLSGTMSIVGPRPALPVEVLAYDAHARGRLTGKPGVTCSWQVSGRAKLGFAEQVDLDIDYLRRQSLLLDLKLMARTVPAVLSGDGAY